MNSIVQTQGPKIVREIPATIHTEENRREKKQLRVAAYCRVSTKLDEQLNSYETQVRYYTDKISNEPDWELVGIFADRGISGTSVKKREEFNHMIRFCKRGRVDMIITKSISRFARNTVDCLKYIRLLREIGVDVFFEEQGLHSIQSGSEFYITIYGSIAQSESENISANVRWGKLQSAKEGKVAFNYKNFLGYRKGADGNPEIVPEEAEIIRLIYNRYLAGDSLRTIGDYLEAKGVPSPSGKKKWSNSTIRSILTNVKYMGDVIINKTYVVDCISKKVKVNNGERPKYYIENNHPAIIDRVTFGRVQEEMARRNGLPKSNKVGVKTEQGKYCGKYALTDLLVCGECGLPYRRCTWTIRGEKKIVWRCINRLEHGKVYCRHSPTMEEGKLHAMIMETILEEAQKTKDVLDILSMHIQSHLNEYTVEDRTTQIQARIGEIEREFRELLQGISFESNSTESELRMTELISEKHQLEQQLAECSDAKLRKAISQSRMEEIGMVMEGMKNHPLEYDDEIVRAIVKKVVVI